MNAIADDIYEFIHNDDGSWTYKIDRFMETKRTLKECIAAVEKIQIQRGIIKEV